MGTSRVAVHQSASQATIAGRTMTAIRRRKNLAIHIILIAGGITMVIPFLWMVSTSLKPLSQIFTLPPRLFPVDPQWGNYPQLFSEVPYIRWYANSLIVATGITVGQLLTASMAGFAFARMRFPGRTVLFFIYLATLMIPAQVNLIPSFILFRILGLLNTYYALIFPGVFTAFGTFLLRQFFLSLPHDLEEAAVIDGAGWFRIYWQIALPLCKPALAALGIFSFLTAWNDFIWPLIVTTRKTMMTVPVGIAFLQDNYGVEWHLIMAGVVIGTIPTLIAFIIGQKQMIKGVTLTGIKG